MTHNMWTNERKLDALLRLPWTLRMDHNVEDGHWSMRVAELPAAIVTAERVEDLEDAFWESLRETLKVFLEHGDVIPLPARVAQYPWEPRQALGDAIYDGSCRLSLQGRSPIESKFWRNLHRYS